jgi:hypothetical protein
MPHLEGVGASLPAGGPGACAPSPAPCAAGLGPPGGAPIAQDKLPSMALTVEAAKCVTCHTPDALIPRAMPGARQFLSVPAGRCTGAFRLFLAVTRHQLLRSNLTTALKKIAFGASSRNRLCVSDFNLVGAR